MRARLARRYGASPLHLLAHLAAFAATAWALVNLLDAGPLGNVVVWLLGAIVLHDVAFLPLYSLLDSLARRAAPDRGEGGPMTINFIRVPAIISGLLLLVYFPSILSCNDRNQEAFTGQDYTGYLSSWLALTAALFLASAFAYAVRLRTGTPSRRRPSRSTAGG